MQQDSTTATDAASRGGSELSEGLGLLLDEWAEAACVRFVCRSYGRRTTDTVSRDDLLQLMRAAQAAERERHADALRCALEALDYCIEDSAELLNERTVQWGSFRKDRQAAMAATLERHRAVAERLRAMLMA